MQKNLYFKTLGKFYLLGSIDEKMNRNKRFLALKLIHTKITIYHQHLNQTQWLEKLNSIFNLTTITDTDEQHHSFIKVT